MACRGGWATRGSAGGIEKRTVRLARTDGLSHSVVDFEDDALGAILAVFLLVLVLDGRERVHDVADIVAGDLALSLISPGSMLSS